MASLVEASIRLREILERESATRLAFKRAKAEVFIDLMSAKGATTTIVWQQLAADPGLQRLEDEYEQARIDLLVENAINGGRIGEMEREE